MDVTFPSARNIHLEGHQLTARTFLLGDEGGLILHLPVELNPTERTMLPIKWFGVSEFGRKYLEAQRVWIERGDQRTLLSRTNQTAFDQELCEVARTFEVDGVRVHQRFFVLNRRSGFIMALECDRPARFVVEPQYDMRYYQAFNTDFSGYTFGVDHSEDGDILRIGNRIENPDAGRLDFHSTVRSVGGPMAVSLKPEDQRLVPRQYLKDEHREKLIHRAYAQTRDSSPDEAPIWDSHTNTVFAPAYVSVDAPATLVHAFDEDAERAETLGRQIAERLPELYAQKQSSLERRLEEALLETGDAEVDLAYKHVVFRFNSCLVARDVEVHLEGQEMQHFTAIFAGDKYFLDAWKRDENISLEALMLANDFETMRAILDDTWRFQDCRTGRLPHIIRLGQPLVYYCSDGTPWALHRLHQYTNVSGDQTLLEEKYEMVEHFFQASLEFVRRGLLPSGGIIERSYLWETWEDTAYTPRDGYPVEIELLWLTVLAEYLPVIRDRNPDLAGQLELVLEEGRHTFETFYLEGYLADSLDYSFRPRRLLTPNGYIAFALGYPLPPELAREMVSVARDQLAGRVGVKSLATRDWPKVFPAKFLEDAADVRDGNMASVGIYNYHRGVEWLWLNQFLVAGELQYGDTDVAYHSYVRRQVRCILDESGVGGLDELSDLHGPLGADFQAWSMAGFIASLHHFAGIDIDTTNRFISVRPCLPKSWPDLLVRRRVAGCRFDTRLRIEPGGIHLVTIEALDPPPSGYRLDVGIRVPHKAAMHGVRINGHESLPHALKFLQPAGVDSPGELWIETSLKERVRVEFIPAGASSA